MDSADDNSPDLGVQASVLVLSGGLQHRGARGQVLGDGHGIDLTLELGTVVVHVLHNHVHGAGACQRRSACNTREHRLLTESRNTEINKHKALTRNLK